MTPTGTCTSEPCTGREGGWTDNVIRYDGTVSRVSTLESGGLTYYDWDGINVIQEKDAAGGVTDRQVHGYAPIPSVGDIALMDKGGTPYVPVSDQPGTVWSLLDDAASKANSYGYDAFGVGRSASETVPNAYRFGTKRMDSDSSLYHCIMRQYLPRSGRFAARDRRFGLGATFSSYVYGRHRPSVFVDPIGMFGMDCRYTGASRVPTPPRPIADPLHTSYGERLFNPIVVNRVLYECECEIKCCDYDWGITGYTRAYIQDTPFSYVELGDLPTFGWYRDPEDDVTKWERVASYTDHATYADLVREYEFVGKVIGDLAYTRIAGWAGWHDPQAEALGLEEGGHWAAGEMGKALLLDILRKRGVLTAEDVWLVESGIRLRQFVGECAQMCQDLKGQKG